VNMNFVKLGIILNQWCNTSIDIRRRGVSKVILLLSLVGIDIIDITDKLSRMFVV
jgi:hypothetical protein